ncbi:MAG: putative phosphatidate cytidylyltransferase [Actinomycetota bacterium]|jgi:phosphatidate cytidylyltransferase
MSDDMWRRTGDQSANGRFDDDDDDDFGELRFSDDDPADRDQSGSAPLSFGSDTGSLPHWTEPPTGELPRLFPDSPTGSGSRPRPVDEPTAPVSSSSLSGSSSSDDDDDVDIWGSYSGAAPRPVPDRPAPPRDLPRDDTSGSRPRVRLGEPTGGVRRDPSGGVRRDPSGGLGREPSGGVRRSGDTTETRRAPAARVADDTGSRPTARPGSRPTQRPASRPAAPRSSSARGTAGRDMPTAVAVGLIIAAAFIGALLWKPVAVLAIVVLVCGLAAIEFFDKVTERGYRPATIVGILAAIGGPLAAYWVGESGLPLVMVLALMAAGITFIGADSLQSPMPNMAITSLGVLWIGLMGSYAALLAGVSNVPGLGSVGTDTLFVLAVGVVANDVGALFVGSAAGRTPLREWISPNKTIEGFLGGAVATLVAVWVVSLQSDTWNDLGEALLLALVIIVLAPAGDFFESMFKRNLDIKDFGTIVPGHGGVLDRFDGFLFVLPSAYYLLQVLEPYAS